MSVVRCPRKSLLYGSAAKLKFMEVWTPIILFAPIVWRSTVAQRLSAGCQPYFSAELFSGRRASLKGFLVDKHTTGPQLSSRFLTRRVHANRRSNR